MNKVAEGTRIGRMAGPGGETCATCYFFRLEAESVHDDDSGKIIVRAGYCRRYPPSHKEPGGSDFPEVTATAAAGSNDWSDDWCGEFKPAIAAPKNSPTAAEIWTVATRWNKAMSIKALQDFLGID